MATIHFAGRSALESRPISVKRSLLAVLLCLTAFLLPFSTQLFVTNDSYGLPANRPAPEFELLDSAGNPRSLDDFAGSFVYLMFGYLACEDICHTQAITFQEIDHFADIGTPISFVFVSIDPERDNPARLAAYFDQRGDSFTSLSSADTRYLQSLALDYNGYFYRGASTSPGSYDIKHAGFFYLIDPQGKIRYTYSPSQRQLQSMLTDLKKLENEYPRR